MWLLLFVLVVFVSIAKHLVVDQELDAVQLAHHVLQPLALFAQAQLRLALVEY